MAKVIEDDKRIVKKIIHGEEEHEKKKWLQKPRKINFLCS